MEKKNLLTPLIWDLLYPKRKLKESQTFSTSPTHKEEPLANIKWEREFKCLNLIAWATYYDWPTRNREHKSFF